MDYLPLGSSGMKVSRLCLGCMSFGGPEPGGLTWSLGYEDSKRIIDRSIDAGINFFDTADVYSAGRSEEILGKAIDGRRDDLVVATKVCSPMGPGPNDKGLSRKHVRHSIRKSLERLRTSYIDLYQIHRWDYDTSIKETLTTLDGLVTDGRVSYIGASSMWAWQFAEALDLSETLGLEPFVSMQNQYNLTYREEEREMIPLCLARGIGMIPWSPLARGFLTGKYKRGHKQGGKRFEGDSRLKLFYFTEQDYAVVDTLVGVAKEKGASPAQVALAWLLHKPGVVSPIIGVTSMRQLDELIEAQSIKLSSGDLKLLEETYKPRPTVGFV
ncbi:MAG: aldo/keto reductase [Thaumarchaeota archaeon]|nr:aldo/keto reductase [Nitrososphaerota archaeon]